MITHMMEIIRHRLGWCPNAQTIRTAPAVFAPPAAMENPAQAGGGTGGSSRIDRGASVAIGSIKILFRNRKLLWFSLLSGLVMIFSLTTTICLQILSGTNPFPGTGLTADPGTLLIAKGSVLLVGLTLTTTLISSFLTFYLLAGLIAYASHLFSGRAITIREALFRAGSRMGSLAGWAVIGSLAGTALTLAMNNSPGNLALIAISLVIGVVFGVLTMFVIPAIILNGDGLFPAILKSLSLFRKIWGEIVICAGIFVAIVFVIMLIAVVPVSLIGFSTGNPAMIGVAVILYLLVMIILLFIGSTIMGIATLGLYMYGTTDRLPGAFTDSGNKRDESSAPNPGS